MLKWLLLTDRLLLFGIFFYFFFPAYSSCIWFPSTGLSALAVVRLGFFYLLFKRFNTATGKIGKYLFQKQEGDFLFLGRLKTTATVQLS